MSNRTTCYREMECAMRLAAIILTLNEEKHIERCITRLSEVVNKIYVVDAYSSDSTVKIAQNLGAAVLQNEWKNHANQFNWALKNIDDDIDWVIRVDADEYLCDTLKKEIFKRLLKIDKKITGISVKRKIIFQGILVKFGGIGSVKCLRIIKKGHGYCESRFMDEHLVVDGKIDYFPGFIYDENLNSLSWWISKHNAYASKEAIEGLNIKYKFLKRKDFNKYSLNSNALIKRILKEYVYYKIPNKIRTSLYYLVRNILLLGFLDSIRGTQFHYLQGYWYRLLVDLKIAEIMRYKEIHNIDIITAIEKVTGEKLLSEDINNYNC